ncbi:MAG: Nuclear transport factor 2 [Caeruleum heppii]|nr:MAG: Nuclear transport factor 2 [Caeruleum heppii]
MAANFEAVAQDFVKFYYSTFQSDRKGLAALYRDNSVLTFEGNRSVGASAIVEKLVSLAFEKVGHEVISVDAQPQQVGEGIVVMVTGRFLVDDESNPMSFGQCFTLLPDGQGSYFIINDLFRIIYAAA